MAQHHLPGHVKEEHRPQIRRVHRRHGTEFRCHGVSSLTALRMSSGTAWRNLPALSAGQSVQVELPGPFSPDHDREVSAYVDGEISAAELYRRTVARYRQP